MYLTLLSSISISLFFFFNDTATTEIYTLSLHDALPIFEGLLGGEFAPLHRLPALGVHLGHNGLHQEDRDRKSTRLNSSHSQISYAVFCLKKKKKHNDVSHTPE